MKKRNFLYSSLFSAAASCLALLTAGCASGGMQKIPLSGAWRFSADSASAAGALITLPGSLASNGMGDEVTAGTPWTGGIADSSFFRSPQYARYRQPGNVKVPFWLQPVKYFKGVAWYEKEVTVPQYPEGTEVELMLERCHWETRIWIDGKEAGMRNSLSVPHRYDLTHLLTPGRHVIRMAVDNRVKDIDPGENSHSISDHTQGNWNGVAGEMALQLKPAVNIRHMSLFPDAADGTVRVRARVANRNAVPVRAELCAVMSGNGLSGVQSRKTVTLAPGVSEVEMTLRAGGAVEKWDEFNPVLYDLRLAVSREDGGGSARHELRERFGFRDIRVQGRDITVNGRKVFLRGTLDCAAFPRTGYPPTDVESWKRIFGICRSHGLNHMRFHSWCPPKAAFVAADEAGFYLEVECASWANQSVTIGDGKPIDRFVWEESRRIVEEYGNHPSFCMMMYGNEPAGAGSHAWLSDFVKRWKETDGRRIYCSSAGWPNLPENEFLNDAAPRIQAWGQGLNSVINASAPSTAYDWSSYVGRFDRPMVAHEIGQWCVYPNFREMDKYDGVMKPRNFEIFRESLRENGMEHLADSFVMASGKLQALCYKADIEASLRTQGMAGFQLLGLYDFPGQGTALVGVLDVFWDEKGYISPEEYRAFCNTTVPLARMDRLVYHSSDTLRADIEVAHFGDGPLKNVGSTVWTLSDADGNVVKTGALPHRDALGSDEIPVGNCIRLGSLSVPLAGVSGPRQLVLQVRTGGFANSWNVWVYPAEKAAIPGEEKILMTDRLDEKAAAVLDGGGTVLLSLRKGSLADDFGGKIQIGFSSIFWNTAYTLGQAPHTLGVLCRPEHPVFDEFPTDYHSDYQWWDAMMHSGAIEFAKINSEISPLVRVIDDWFTNRPLALMFEAKVGKGKIVVSGIDFWQNMDTRKEAAQMLYSLKKYMCSDKFNPSVEVDRQLLEKMTK